MNWQHQGVFDGSGRQLVSVDEVKMLPRLLRAMGLGPGDRLVVRSADGAERELPLTCLDEECAGEIHGS